MKVADVMSKNLKTISPQDTIKKAAKIMNHYRIGSLVVTSGIMVSGIITERDILKAFAKGLPPETKVKDVMTGYVITISPDAKLSEAAERMEENGIKRLPVVDKTKCVGIITITDLIAHEKKMLDELKPLLLMKKRTLEKEKGVKN